MLTFDTPKPQPKEWRFEGESWDECETKAQNFIDNYENKGNLYLYQSFQDYQKKEFYVILKEKKPLENVNLTT